MMNPSFIFHCLLFFSISIINTAQAAPKSQLFDDVATYIFNKNIAVSATTVSTVLTRLLSDNQLQEETEKITKMCDNAEENKMTCKMALTCRFINNYIISQPASSATAQSAATATIGQETSTILLVVFRQLAGRKGTPFLEEVDEVKSYLSEKNVAVVGLVLTDCRNILDSPMDRPLGWVVACDIIQKYWN